MDLSNPSLWRLAYLQSFSSEYVRALSTPIPTFDTPDLSDRFIRVKVTSSTAKQNWKFAGTAKQIINAGGVDSIVKSVRLELDGSLLIDFSEFESYRIRVKFPAYFTQATISIFGYIGG